MPWHFSFFFLILYLCKHYPVKNRTSSVPQSSWYVPSWWNLTALTKLWAITTLQAFEAIISFVFMIVLKTKCASLDKALLDLNLSIHGKLKSRDITLPTKVRLVKAMVFPVVMYGCESGMWRRLSAEELMLLNCGVGEDSWESLRLQGDPTSTS